jgi:hypothetical protein
LPFRSGAGIADTLRNRTGVQVAVIDPPAFLRNGMIAAAGEAEGGHARTDGVAGRAFFIRPEQRVQPS